MILSVLMKVLSWIGRVLLFLLLFIVVWGGVIEPRFLLDVQRTEADLPNLPEDWEGRPVALLADFQVGMWLDNTGMVARAVERAIEADPSLVLIAGDFVYKPDSSTVRHAVDLVRPLVDAGVPVLAVLGNHDYSLNKQEDPAREELARYLEAELESAGIQVLHNEVRSVMPEGGGTPVQVVGIGSVWADRARPAEALASVPAGAPRVVFMHNPVAYRDLPAGTAPLTLAGHTHGGQIRLPFTPANSWLDIARSREVIADGWARTDVGAAGNRLYVNRGIGFSLVPLRIFCRPELTLVTLRGVPVETPADANVSAPAGS